MVTLAAHTEGAVFGATTAEIQSLMTLLQGTGRDIVVDPGEWVGRSIASVASFIQSGGVWVSYGGYPFYYNGKGQPVYVNSGLSGVLNALKVKIPQGFAINDWSSPLRIVQTTSATLPKGWVGSTPISTNGVYQWPIIGVKAGDGWWFYASGDVGEVAPEQYALFIKQYITPPLTSVASASTQSESVSWIPWVLGGALVLGGVAFVATRAHQHRR